MTSQPAPFPEDSPYSSHENSEIITDFHHLFGGGGGVDTLVDGRFDALGWCRLRGQ